MSLTYSITREDAAEALNISTRTLDRYIRKGKVSYKKIANRVLLAKEDIDALKIELESIGDAFHYSEVVSQNSDDFSDETKNLPSHNSSSSDISEIKEAINNSFQSFLGVLKEKDNIINEQNQTILGMNTRIVELESKIKNSIALPDYTTEKENLIIEKEKLTYENTLISEELKKQKLKSIGYIIAIILCIVFIFLFMFFK